MFILSNQSDKLEQNTEKTPNTKNIFSTRKNLKTTYFLKYFKTMKTLKASNIYLLFFATACLLISTMTLFTACEQQELLEGAPAVAEQRIPKILPKNEGTPLITETEGELKSRYQLTLKSGWNFVKNVTAWELQNGTTTIKVSSCPKNIYFASFARPGSWTYITSLTGTVQSWASKTRTYNASTPLPAGKSYVGVWFYNWASTNANCEVTVNFTQNVNNTVFPTGFAIGLESNDVISRVDGTNSMTTIVNDGKNRYDYLQESGAKFVRINFLKPKNYTGSDLGWIAYYDAVVNELTNRNIPIYAVVTDVIGGVSGGGETSYPSYGNDSQKKAWIDKYATAFGEITKRYKDKITHYESFNEPNNWIAQQKPAMDLSDYAYLLKQTWNTVKAGGNPNNITLISGPVMAHDAGANSMCGWQNVYNNGACYLGKAIDHNAGTNYFDAVGYHIYVAQYNGDAEYGVQESANALKDMLDGKGLNKDIYVSEIGWDTNKVSSSTQVSSIEKGLNKLRSLKDTHRIKGVCLFSLSDFQTETIIEQYGLVTPDYMNGGDGYNKSSWTTFKNMYKGN